MYDYIGGSSVLRESRKKTVNKNAQEIFQLFFCLIIVCVILVLQKKNGNHW
jgi:hypothetical protein